MTLDVSEAFGGKLFDGGVQRVHRPKHSPLRENRKPVPFRYPQEGVLGCVR